MRKQLFITSVLSIAAVSFILSSCGGSSSSSSESMLFGKVPAIAAELNTQSEELKAKLGASESESDAKAVFEKYEKFYAEAREKAEKAAQEWSGSTLTLENTDELTVKTPVTVQFKDFFSKGDIDPRYDLAGEVVAAKDIPLEGKDALAFNDGTMTPLSVDLIGLDAEGNEVISHQVGSIARTSTGEGTAVITAGTPVNINAHNLTMSDSKAAEYAKIKSLKLAIRYLK